MAQIRFLEPDEIEKLLSMPNLRSQTGLRNRVILQVLWECGLRINEALSLRVRDVVIGEKKVVVQFGKGGRSRVVYWRTDELSMLLERWKKIRPKSDYLFCTIRSTDGKGKKLNQSGFRLQFNRYVEKAGLPSSTTPHVIRHSAATRLLREGTNLRVLQEILGHQSLATTQIYCHVEDADVRKAMTGEQ